MDEEFFTDEGSEGLTRYMNEVGKTKLLTPERERELAIAVRNGDEKARRLIIKANLRLVITIANRYRGMGLPFQDLINEGNIGLIRGVERFKLEMGVKMSTYFSWWIKERIKQALSDQARTIRLPAHISNKMRHVVRAESELAVLFGRTPSDEEIAEYLRIPVLNVSLLRMVSGRTLPLDSFVSDKQFHDHSAPDPFAEAVKNDLFSILRGFVQSLSDKEKKVIKLRFGFHNGGLGMTLGQTAKVFNVTHNRIGQIQEQVIKKLRRKFIALETPGYPVAVLS